MLKNIRYLTLAALLILTACSDGPLEMIRTDTMVPYGNTRTAGTGVAYVRAKMLPEKCMNLAPATPPAQPQPATDTEKLFNKIQKK